MIVIVIRRYRLYPGCISLPLASHTPPYSLCSPPYMAYIWCDLPGLTANCLYTYHTYSPFRAYPTVNAGCVLRWRIRLSKGRSKMVRSSGPFCLSKILCPYLILFIYPPRPLVRDMIKPNLGLSCWFPSILVADSSHCIPGEGETALS